MKNAPNTSMTNVLRENPLSERFDQNKNPIPQTARSEDSRASGEIRALLALSGKSIGPYDVLIAGQNKARNLVLVTKNVDEFARVSELLIENWQNNVP